jgi:trk system potassium uptake protein TrkA
VKKRALLIGGFDKARSLAEDLDAMGYGVTIVNADQGDCLDLAQMNFVTVIHGDGTKPEALREAGAQDVHLAVALTPRDADNLVACQLCKKCFRAKRTVALLVDPKKAAFFSKMGVDDLVCAVTSIENVIRQQEPPLS